MKKWVSKLIEQFDFEWSPGEGGLKGKQSPAEWLSDERATLLFLIDTFNKHLIEFEGHPVRKVRETLDEFAKELIQGQSGDNERILFRFRQYFSGYRIAETAYFQKTFEEFRSIIWDFVDQLAEDMGQEQKDDLEITNSLNTLKDAVESNSIDALKDSSRKFIDCYVEKQFKKDKRRSTRMKSIRKNLSVVKKQLNDAQDSLKLDHMTQALNRKAFEAVCHEQTRMAQLSPEYSVTLMLLDIDYFKRINDTFGHPVGDFVLKELVKTLKAAFARDEESVARIGGEEFAIVIPEANIEVALRKADEVLQRVRSEAYVIDANQIRFTVSIGVAQLAPSESVESWVKRADLALYNSKNSGRNRVTVAPTGTLKVA